MKYFLIYCYTTNQYKLINSTEINNYQNPELLFEFDGHELRIAQKVLTNLKLEQANREQKQQITKAA